MAIRIQANQKPTYQPRRLRRHERPPYVSLKGPSTSLFPLPLDVCVDDYDILQGVIRCAPMVEKLKLLERLPSNQVSYVVCRLLSSGTD